MALDPCTPFEVTADDGARVVACAHGGQVLGWTPAGGDERLWLSREAACGPGQAIRGGMPVIWPQFSNRGPGPKHGIARSRPWTVRHAETSGGGDAEIVMTLEATDETRALLSADFRLELTARASGPGLEVTLAVENRGAGPLAFTAALHTYLRVSDAQAATLEGLAGHVGEDNAAGGSSLVVPSAPLVAAESRDWAVREVGSGEVVISDPVLPELALSARGFDDRVVWNPGPEGAPSDVHPGGANEYVCVEPAALTPIDLAPASRWVGVQRLLQR